MLFFMKSDCPFRKSARCCLKEGNIVKIAMVTLFIISMIFPEQAHAQYLYFSPTGHCSVDGINCWQYFSEYYVFIRFPGLSDCIGASFRLESDVFGPEDFVSVDPHMGVIIENGDLFSGITLSWPAGHYTNDTLLTIPIELNEPHSSAWNVAWTREVKIFKANGDTLYLDDVRFYCSHCYGYGGDTIRWKHPDTLVATIGKQSTLDIPCIGSSAGGLSGTYLDVVEQLNWVDGCTHCGVHVECGPCPWSIQHVYVHLSVPSETSPETHNLIRLIPSGPCCMDDSTSFYVRAVPEIGVEETSWGKLKSLFKDR